MRKQEGHGKRWKKGTEKERKSLKEWRKTRVTGGMWEFKEKQRVSGKKSSSGFPVRSSAFSSAVTQQDPTLTMLHHNKGLGHNEGHQATNLPGTAQHFYSFSPHILIQCSILIGSSL